jgi:hypothetical protein
MIALLAIIPLTLPGILLWYFSHRSDGHGSPPSSDIPTQRAMWYIGSLGFFMNPSQFLKDCMKMGKDSIFSFRILEVSVPINSLRRISLQWHGKQKSTVVVLRGVAGRDAFFSKGSPLCALMQTFTGNLRLSTQALISWLDIHYWGVVSVTCADFCAYGSYYRIRY